MEVAIEMESLSVTRKSILNESYKKGVVPGSNKAYYLGLAVEETLVNCRKHGGCKKAEVKIARDDDNISIAIQAPCFNDPEIVKGWFNKSCVDLTLGIESGRGCAIVKELADDIEYCPGSIYLIFNLSVAEPVLATA